MKFFKDFLLFLILVLALFLLVLSMLNLNIIHGTSDDIFVNDDSIEKKYDCILVLGAGIHNNATPSDMLEDRLKVAISLYKAGHSDTLILSGDRSGDHYDEVSVMKNYCLKQGIPEEAVVCDGIGYSTYESVVNLYNAEEYDSVIIVTQGYHLNRAIYIAEEFGLDVVGVSASIRDYRGQSLRDLREGLARFKDYFQVMINTN